MASVAFDASGKVAHPSSADLAEADKDTSILGYVHGTMEDGRPYYAYVAVPPSKYKEFHALTSARKAMVIGDYGTVIAAGFEPSPPPEVVREMREMYGFDDQYETKLTQEALKQQRVFFEKQETLRIDNIVSMLKKKSNDDS